MAATGASKLISTRSALLEGAALRSISSEYGSALEITASAKPTGSTAPKKSCYALGQSDWHGEERCRQHAERCGLSAHGRSSVLPDDDERAQQGPREQRQQDADGRHRRRTVLRSAGAPGVQSTASALDRNRSAGAIPPPRPRGDR